MRKDPQDTDRPYYAGEPAMTQLQEKAIARSADHENLVGELVAMLKETHAFLTDERIGTWQYMEGSQFYSDTSAVAKKIDAVIAKAEAQQ
jgi:hypothetical protein